MVGIGEVPRQPRRHHAVAFLDVLDLRSFRQHHPGGLVTDELSTIPRVGAVDLVQLRVAQSGRKLLYHYLIRARVGQLEIHQAQRGLVLW